MTSSIARASSSASSGRRREQVEREPLRRAPPDSGQLRELDDEVLDRRAEHAGSVSVRFGRAGRPSGRASALVSSRAAARRGRRDRPGRSRTSSTPSRLRAERSASFTAASTMSASSSGSSGSIAFGSMRISTTSPAPFAFTVTIPPPAEASTTSLGRLFLRLGELGLHPLRFLEHLVHVELHSSGSTSRASNVSLSERDPVVLGDRLVVLPLLGVGGLARLEDDREPRPVTS